jgi:sugar phosphate isomerase/epimerase
MFKTAFSTIACPEWTLDRVTRVAAEAGYDGVELRTFGFAGTELACDPALTAPEKVRRLFRDHGSEISCLATSVAFDEPIRPTVIGHVISDTQKSIRLAKAAIDLAAQLECPFVRVYGFELPPGEAHSSAMARVVDRLSLAVDAARHSGVKVLVESGGSFAHASALAALIDEVANPLVGAAYSAPVAWAEGEAPVAGIETLGDRLACVKLRDFNADRRPCLPGEGVVPCDAVVRALIARRFGGWVTFEWDRLWDRDLAPAERALPEAVRRIYSMAGSARQGRPQGAASR